MSQRIFELLSLAKDGRAAVAVIVAVMAPVLIGFAALATDVPYWYGTREALQTAVDAAAMSAALTGFNGTAAQTLGVLAADSATSRQFDFQHPSPNTNFIMTETSEQPSGSTLYTATASVPLPLFFSVLALEGKRPEASASASAMRQARPASCVLSLTRRRKNAIATKGGGAIIAKNCGVFANSKAGYYAISAGDYGNIQAKTVGAVGGVTGVPPGYNVFQNASAEADPLASMQNPPALPAGFQPCQSASTISNQDGAAFSGGACFEGGLKISTRGTVTFGPGIYYFSNGNLDISGASQIVADGATFVFENNAGFRVSGHETRLDLRAPSTNCVQPNEYASSAISSAPSGICGVLIYQARNDIAPDALHAATGRVSGIIYAPGASLRITGQGTLAANTGSDGTSGTLSVVADTIVVSGGAQLDASAAPTMTSYAVYLAK
ncbi:MAG TPA: pilus assembly protein TadG-related protein [Acidobacteriaceae bacterium]|nr:pilus assembly protein TadG-related protein [Acidobacteriaceae bacterium]